MRIVRGRMPTLEMINERFARLFRVSLYNLLRRSPEISVAPVAIKKFSEYVHTLHVPTNLNLVKINPFRGTALIVLTRSWYSPWWTTSLAAPAGTPRSKVGIHGHRATHHSHDAAQRVRRPP